MKPRLKDFSHLLFIFLVWINPFCASNIEAKEFVVVIDPGHGGHDPGAIGKMSKEKNINLSVALKLGKLIENNCKDVKVIYTRQKDVFVTLNRRAEIANNAKADLFISIHTNALANNKTMKGASTWTLGLAKSEANLDVAKRENSVILYEEDYKTSYAGFDPNSSESYIIFEFLQDKYMASSVHLASLMQQHFKTTCKRIDRGVHQAGFLVLKASAMPSVLVELGFISTPEEERYLNTEEGQITLSKGLYQAFLQYKKEQQLRTDSQVGENITTTPDTNDLQETNKNEVGLKQDVPEKTATKTSGINTTLHTESIVFKVQILTSSKSLDKNSKEFKGIKDTDVYKEKGLYKYTYGASENYNEILRIRKTLLNKFPDAFVIAFKDGNKMDINAAIAEYKKKNK